MATMKAIKKRISSVNNTKKIMKAMDLVAASKLQKAKSRLDDFRPLYDNIKLVMDGIKAGVRPEDEVAFTENREVKSIAYIVLTSDRGLCGGYNANVSKEALANMNSHEGMQEHVITVGTKGWEYFRRRGKNVVHRYAGASEASSFESAELIGSRIASMYTSGEVDEVYLVFTHFESILTHVPQVEKLLPIRPEATEDSAAGTIEMSYDPDIGTFISYAVPMYLNVTIYGAMMESAVCEYAARMTSMDAATRNAAEIIEDLTLEYNRKRQSMITQEITEIVSGANALT
jgi:F-type H+-transporting ATPase subunit gamma